MKLLKTIAAPLLFSALLAACNNNSSTIEEKKAEIKKETKDSPRRVVILDPEALKFLDSTSPVEVVAKGFSWTEGPLYIADGDYFLFSDIPNNKIYKWKNGGDTSTYLTPSGYTGILTSGGKGGSNGLLLNKEGKLILMHDGDRRVAMMNAPLNAPKSSFTTLADNYNGKHLNSPNDGVCAANGDIYFTDPAYGLKNGLEDSAKQLSYQGVFVLRSNGKLELVTDEIKYPNGITLSPDGHFLYVANSDESNKIWMKFELDEKGLIKNRSTFYRAIADEGVDNGNPDGLKMSKDGYLFATGPQGLWLFNPSGKVIARIYTGDLTSNCALSANEKELLMTCNSFVMRVKLK